MTSNTSTALITGRTSGIGRATANKLAQLGIHAVVVGRSAERGRKTIEEIRAAGGKADLIASDLRDAASAREVAKKAIELGNGHVDILINNAGMGLYEPAWNTPLADARRLFELNFFAPLAMTQLVAPHMRARSSGTIVNVSSVAGKVTLPWLTLYSASKYALVSLTDGLRMELKKAGIHTITVCPGYVKTGFQDHALGGPPPRKISSGKQFAITPEQCAESIARGVERGARTVMAPRSGWLFVLAERLFPSLVDAQLAALIPHDV